MITGPTMPLAAFDPRVREWFLARHKAPTDIQQLAWPRIAAGEHLLLMAPTGSGKTMAAFLWALDRLATGAWEGGTVRVLYVSPLKALGNDIRENLTEPLAALRERLGPGAPAVEIAVRTGDTTPAQRRRMARQPPGILVTTPESLNLLLASRGGRALLGGIRLAVLDEIHAVAGEKRGAYLMTAVERLVPLSGEFQRIALSATVRPPETVAALVGGYDAVGRARPVGLVASRDVKRTEITVHGLPSPRVPSPLWPPLVEQFRERIGQNRSTLLFVNNRALSEKLARWINDASGAPLAYAHHGSLSREIREVVEGRLREGSLRALVATSSLELGIDIGSLDEVLLVQSPKTVHSAVQRIGRAGHGVGDTCRARLYPTHGRDLLDAAVLVPMMLARDVEPVRPVRNPLDVLAQVLVAMAGVGECDLGETYALLRRCFSFRTLPRESFDRVVAMLLGRYEETRVRELRPRLDERDGRVTARPGAQALVWRSGGVIPDRGYFTVRHAGSGERIGELDEEYVWEGRTGQLFTLGARVWRIERITRHEVEALPADGKGIRAPFWRADAWNRDWALCERIGLFLEEADARLDDPAFADALRKERHMDEGAVAALLEFLRTQRERTGAPLPHRWHLLLERTGGREPHLLLHAPWGGRMLRPLAIALRELLGSRGEVFSNDDTLLLPLTGEGDLAEWLTAERVLPALRRSLGGSGLFGARFRENAMRALLLPRQRAGKRMPLWLTRLRGKKLLASVAGHADFPIVAETWRSCLEDEFDLDGLAARLDEVRTGRIRISRCTTATPSPFAGGVAWRAINTLMYEDETPERVPVLGDGTLAPVLPPAIVAELESKLGRTAPGYEPRELQEWLDHAGERLLLRQPGIPESAEFVQVGWGGGWTVARQEVGWIERARAGDDRLLARLSGALLAGRGPVDTTTLAAMLDLPEARVEASLQRLRESGSVVRLETRWCDAENLERLSRMARSAARAAVRSIDVARLPLLLATMQGLVAPADPEDEAGVRARIEPLFGYPVAAALLEGAILPARIAGYRPALLDALARGSDLGWFGAGRERVALAFTEEIGLFGMAPPGDDDILPAGGGAQDFFALLSKSGLASADLAARLWNAAWEGRARNDSFPALRHGIASRFRASPPAPQRRARGGWASSRPLLGLWSRLEAPPQGDGPDDDRERVRQLLRRYGILCRELCAPELPLLRWSRLARPLRLMELSGEIAGGRLLDGVPGLHFASHDALSRTLDDDAIWWCNATDPASLCGLDLLPGLPARAGTTWLVHHGAAPVLVVSRSGGRVELRGAPDPRYGVVFAALLGHQRRIEVEEFGAGEERFLLSLGFRREMRSLVLERFSHPRFH